MIYEIALLPVHAERVDEFRRAFAEVAPLLRRANGYRGHMLAQGIETPERFNLIVRWESLGAHTDFEAGEDHRVFMLGLEEYFSEEPQVYHIEGAAFTAGEGDGFFGPETESGFCDEGAGLGDSPVFVRS